MANENKKLIWIGIGVVIVAILSMQGQNLKMTYSIAPPAGFTCDQTVDTQIIFTSSQDTMSPGNSCSSTAIVQLFSCSDSSCVNRQNFGEKIKLNGLNPSFSSLGIGNIYTYYCYNCVSSSCTSNSQCTSLNSECKTGVCSSGSCISQNKANGIACTGGTCQSGSCVQSLTCDGNPEGSMQCGTSGSNIVTQKCISGQWVNQQTCPLYYGCSLGSCTLPPCTTPDASLGKFTCRNGDVMKCTSTNWAKQNDCESYSGYKSPCLNEKIARATETDAKNDCTIQTCSNQADTNQDCTIIFTEVRTYAEKWVAQQGPTLSQVIAVAEIWVNGGGY